MSQKDYYSNAYALFINYSSVNIDNAVEYFTNPIPQQGPLIGNLENILDMVEIPVDSSSTLTALAEKNNKLSKKDMQIPQLPTGGSGGGGGY